MEQFPEQTIIRQRIIESRTLQAAHYLWVCAWLCSYVIVRFEMDDVVTINGTDFPFLWYFDRAVRICALATGILWCVTGGIVLPLMKSWRAPGITGERVFWFRHSRIFLLFPIGVVCYELIRGALIWVI